MKFLLYGRRVWASSAQRSSARSLKIYSKAQANKVIKLFIVWLQKGKAREIERTSTLSSFSSQFLRDNKIQKRNVELIVKEETRVLFKFLPF